MVEDDGILAALRGSRGDLATSCRALIDLANAKGGDDNVTVVLVRAVGPAKPTD